MKRTNEESPRTKSKTLISDVKKKIQIFAPFVDIDLYCRFLHEVFDDKENFLNYSV